MFSIKQLIAEDEIQSLHLKIIVIRFPMYNAIQLLINWLFFFSFFFCLFRICSFHFHDRQQIDLKPVCLELILIHFAFQFLDCTLNITSQHLSITEYFLILRSISAGVSWKGINWNEIFPLDLLLGNEWFLIWVTLSHAKFFPIRLKRMFLYFV